MKPELHLEEPCEANGFLVDHVLLISHNLKYKSGYGLIEDEDAAVKAACKLYYAPFALLSHGTEQDPIINYANITAQQLFEMNWHEFVQLPSRLSAEDTLQAERTRLLQRVSEHGFIDDYSGIRVSSTGRRFLIELATVWNLQDNDGRYCGQAAMFSNWKHLI